MRNKKISQTLKHFLSHKRKIFLFLTTISICQRMTNEIFEILSEYSVAFFVKRNGKAYPCSPQKNRNTNDGLLKVARSLTFHAMTDSDNITIDKILHFILKYFAKMYS